MSHAIAKETPAPAAPPSTAAIIGFEQLNIEFIKDEEFAETNKLGLWKSKFEYPWDVR